MEDLSSSSRSWTSEDAITVPTLKSIRKVPIALPVFLLLVCKNGRNIKNVSLCNTSNQGRSVECIFNLSNSPLTCYWKVRHVEYAWSILRCFRHTGNLRTFSVDRSEDEMLFRRELASKCGLAADSQRSGDCGERRSTGPTASSSYRTRVFWTSDSSTWFQMV